MELLRALTLIYAAVLVLALAASLAVIWVYLRRISSVLAEVRAALATVSDETAPLQEHLRWLQDTSTGSAVELMPAPGRLTRADERLAVLAKRLGAAEPSG